MSKSKDSVFVYYKYKFEEKQYNSVEKFSIDSLEFDENKIMNSKWKVILNSNDIANAHLVPNKE